MQGRIFGIMPWCGSLQPFCAQQQDHDQPLAANAMPAPLLVAAADKAQCCALLYMDLNQVLAQDSFFATCNHDIM